MDVLYYHYFLFYKYILRDNEPHLLTTLALTASLGLMITKIIDLISIILVCNKINSFSYYGTFVIILIANVLIFHRNKRAETIIKEQPLFFNNKFISIVLTIVFFISTLSFMFWGAEYALTLLERHCR